MNENPSDWRPEPEPQHELDRIIPRAVGEAALQGKMFRLLMALEEVFIYVPAHPELVGETMRTTDEALTFCKVRDEQGREFAPVFTSLVAAEFEMRRFMASGAARPMIAGLPPDICLGYLITANCPAKVLAAGGGAITLQLEALKNLVEGEFTNKRVNEQDEGDSVCLQICPVAEIPSKLRQAIRTFCAVRKSAVGVWVFHQLDPVTQTYPKDDVRVLLWMRHEDHAFYNDFCVMGGRLTPDRLTFYCTAVTATNGNIVEFLQKYEPLWPIMKGPLK